MDWYSILGAAIGGGVGAGLGSLLGRVFPESVRAGVSIVLTVALGAGGSLVARHYFSSTEAQIERGLMSDPAVRPLVEAWRESDPQSFETLKADLARNAQSMSQTELIDLTRAHYMRVGQQRLIFLDDAALVSLLEVGRDQFRELRTSRPQACQAMFHGRPMGDLRPYLSREVAAREQAVFLAAFRAQPQPGPMLSESQAAEIGQQIFDATRVRVGDDVALLDPNANVAGNEARMCEVAEEFFVQFVALPPQSAAAMLRTISRPS